MIDYKSKIVDIDIAIDDVSASHTNIMKDFETLKESGEEKEINVTERIGKLGKIVSDCGELMDNATNVCAEAVKVTNELMSEAVNDVAGTAAREVSQAKAMAEIVLQKTNIELLEIKRFMLKVELEILRQKKKTLENSASAKEDPGSEETRAKMIASLQALAKATDAILSALQSVLSMLMSFGGVDADSMSMMMTPKDLQIEAITPYNMFGEMCSKLSDDILKKITEASESVGTANEKAKQSAMRSAAGDGINLIMGGGLEKTANGVKLLTSGGEMIFKTVEGIISAFVAPEPLPKYEKVSIINPSFLTWLLPSFESVVHKMFGFPGMD